MAGCRATKETKHICYQSLRRVTVEDGRQMDDDGLRVQDLCIEVGATAPTSAVLHVIQPRKNVGPNDD